MEIETWWLYDDETGDFIQKLGIRDDLNLDNYVDNPYEKLAGEWSVVSYNEQSHEIYVR